MADISPAKDHKLPRQAYAEFKKYMEEMVEEQKRAAASKERTANVNHLESFVSAGQPTHPSPISDDAVFGNLFIFILTGHETSANTMTFALSLLACRLDFQKALQ